MSREIKWSKQAYQELLSWSKSNKKTVQKITELIKDIDENHPKPGLGKPEQLKGMNDIWSRRINEKDRLVYKVLTDEILIYQCKGHYQDT